MNCNGIVNNYLKYCDGVIVGTSLKENNMTNNPVSKQNVREFIKVVKNNF